MDTAEVFASPVPCRAGRYASSSHNFGAIFERVISKKPSLVPGIITAHYFNAINV
jgi:hypothetical protein